MLLLSLSVAGFCRSRNLSFVNVLFPFVGAFADVAAAATAAAIIGDDNGKYADAAAACNRAAG